MPCLTNDDESEGFRHRRRRLYWGALCKAFAEAGWNVVTYDNLSRGWRDFVKWGPLVEGDVLDEVRLTEAMREAKPDAVAHFAALTYVGESVEDPAKYYRNNSMGALAVLDAMRAADCDQIIFSSTAAIYGTPIRHRSTKLTRKTRSTLTAGQNSFSKRSWLTMPPALTLTAISVNDTIPSITSSPSPSEAP